MTLDTVPLLAWWLLAQAAPPASPALTPAEKTRLERETGLDDRVRVYEGATTRLLRQVQRELKQDRAGEVAGSLEAWGELLGASLADIRARATRNKRSRAVIRYEIALRKAIASIRELALVTPDHRDALEQWLAAAEPVRKGLVEILFPQ